MRFAVLSAREERAAAAEQEALAAGPDGVGAAREERVGRVPAESGPA
jgi:hypothetical protein